MFRNAIVRLPGRSISDAITSSSSGKPDYKTAMEQHEIYCVTLKELGLEVRILPADENYPDSVFIEDVALCTPAGAIITNPAAPSRKGETGGIREVLSDYFSRIWEIKSPGTLEAGDVMMVGSTYYIGISDRTNSQGADQLISILESLGFRGVRVPVGKLLHLKSGISYIGNNNLLVSGQLMENANFKDYHRIPVTAEEQYAANSLWVNGTVLVPGGYPDTKKEIEEAGYKTRVLNVSEFRKADGGLSCLSLRF